MYINGKNLLNMSDAWIKKTHKQNKTKVCFVHILGLTNQKDLTFYPQAPTCLFCEPRGCSGMTPQASSDG